MNNEELEIDLLRLIRALWKRAVAVVLVTVLFAVAFFGYTAAFVKPLYKAKALMYVNSNSVSLGGTKVSISQSELTAAKTLVDTYIVIMKTRTTLEEVIERAELPYSYGQLQGMIEASDVNGTEVFSVEVTSTNPREAALIANAIAEILPSKISAIVEGSSARIVDYAVVPAEKDSPSLMKNAVIGAALGFVLSCGVVIVLELLDDKIHDSDYLIQTYDIPVLAVIPDLLSAKNSNSYYRNADQQTKKAR